MALVSLRTRRWASRRVALQLAMIGANSLRLQAMNGLPGPFIKYFLKQLGHDGEAGPWGCCDQVKTTVQA